jgi:hypothetical protein
MLLPYVPPIAAVQSLDWDKAMDITRYEETANINSIKPHTRIFYELNCLQRMLRELSITIEVNGQYGSVDKPKDWRFIPPEGNGASLQKIICRAP